MALHWERLGRAGVAIGAGGKADARSLRKQTTACTASAADDLHRGSSTLSARATQRLVPSTRWRRSRRQTASRPKRDGCSEREAKYGQNYMSRSFQPPRAVRHVARSLLGLQSASGRSFGRQRGSAPPRGIVKRRTRPSPQRVRALPRRSRRPSVRLRSIWGHSTRTPLPCVPRALQRPRAR